MLEQSESLAFFFSSRRRHTRLQGDWSSDVCSSDLQMAGFGGGRRVQRHEVRLAQHVVHAGPRLRAQLGHHHGRRRRRIVRSEEHTSELQSPCNLVCRLLLEKKKKAKYIQTTAMRNA